MADVSEGGQGQTGAPTYFMGGYMTPEETKDYCDKIFGLRSRCKQLLKVVEEWRNYIPFSTRQLLTFPPDEYRYFFPIHSEEIELPFNDVLDLSHLELPDKRSPAFNHGLVRPLLGEGLVVDTGAVEDLTGYHFVARHALEAARHGFPPTWMTLAKPRRLSGVGDACKICTNAVRLTCALATGQKLEYEAPVIPDSSVPPLMGTKTMVKLRAIVDPVSKKLALIPEGKHHLIVYPEGTVFWTLEETPSGHLVLPVSHWNVQESKL